MPNERAILCGDVPSSAMPFGGGNPISLHLWGPRENVTCQIGDIQSLLLQNVPSRFQDLVEIATFVYCGDQAVKRGGEGVLDVGENWRRRLFFRIPVRDPDFWNSSAVLAELTGMLGFISEDEYTFEFRNLRHEPPRQGELNLGRNPPEEVVLFSGGLDSLGGAIQESVVDRRLVALVNHRPTHKMAKRYEKLNEMLHARAPKAPVHVPVVVNKVKSLGREYTQRTRSFLYASLAATVAHMSGLSRIRFYENGIVSLNFPVSEQVVGARASRTTHPRSIRGFSNLLSLVADRHFAVENPFLWKTKADVVAGIRTAGCADMIKFATSCTHTWQLTKLKTHCGACSQCIDRRFAVLSCGLDEDDPSEAYGVDLLTGERAEGEPRTMLASYVETASEVSRMSAADFFSRYGEISRVVRQLDGTPDVAAMQVFDLYKRHATQVTEVVRQAIADHAREILERQLSPSSLLRLVCNDGAEVSRGDSQAAGTAVETPPTENYCWRKGECWAIRFQGAEEKIYTPETGFEYLQVLLGNAGVQFSAAELDCRRRVSAVPPANAATSDEVASTSHGGRRPSNAGPQLDGEAIQSYRLRLEEIEEDLSHARRNNDASEIDRLESEKEWIRSELSSARGFGGRIRNLADEREKVRNKVCNAIRRALPKIKQYDNLLWEHLRKPILNLGHTLSYIPSSGMKWSTGTTLPN